jgi:Fe-S oxidoreductase
MAAAGDKEALPHLTEFLKDLYHCADCGYCVEAIWEERGIEHVCATLGSHSPALSYSGQGYLKLARAWLEGESFALPGLAERVFSCTGCGNCERICPIGLRPMQINRALRRELNDRGAAPGSAIAVREAITAEQNPAAAPFAERYRWAATVDAREGGEVLYLPGCAAAHGRPAEAQAAVALLGAAGVGVQLLGAADRCCGAPLRELGMAEDARRQGTQLEARLAERSYELLLTSGCECANTFAGVDRHRSFVAWLAEALREGALRPTARGDLPRVACLESCQATQAARAGAGDDNQALRDLLAALGVEVIGDAASPYRLCCGAAGGMAAMQPESSRAMARARIREISGAQALISADPRCVAQFETARESGDPPVYGVAEFITRHFALGGQQP